MSRALVITIALPDEGTRIEWGNAHTETEAPSYAQAAAAAFFVARMLDGKSRAGDEIAQGDGQAPYKILTESPSIIEANGVRVGWSVIA